ncbi:GIY-YIG nuclease family protein [Streptomyces sp. TM32]|uniref:GIY-YIG nuclease family protein n=1 Tax=Streptomyces sp. TM32 TaxID=1652669 RepID=UPI00101068B6|nr:GIY-YIG nuclease family protein [Streptomyces sp. TM32]RXS78889.1 GIY-YIG nuclease family protein [Streptomyces sp. TM32]
MQSDRNSHLSNQQKALDLARRPRIPRDEWLNANRELRQLLPMHIPLRRLDRNAPTANLLKRGEERPEWWLPLWPYLYRFYDAELKPVYIGITSCHATRIDNHRRRSEWWPLAEYIAISVYPTEKAVAEAERAALRREQPRFNKQGVRGPANISIHTRGPAEEAAALLFRQADPAFVAELAALLAQPERFPQPTPPPPARFAEETD